MMSGICFKIIYWEHGRERREEGGRKKGGGGTIIITDDENSEKKGGINHGYNKIKLNWRKSQVLKSSGINISCRFKSVYFFSWN